METSTKASTDILVTNTGEFRNSKFYVLTATRHTESSWGSEGGPYNYFTKRIAEAAGVSMPADKNGDSCINLHELFLYVKENATGPYNYQGVDYYQHVQEYPANSTYKLFAR